MQIMKLLNIIIYNYQNFNVVKNYIILYASESIMNEGFRINVRF